MNKLNITDVVINPRFICETLQSFTVYAVINGKPLGFTFSDRDHDCNEAFEATKLEHRIQPYDFYKKGSFISGIASGGGYHQYALSIPEDVLFSKPKVNQKDFGFTGQYYSTAPVVSYFKKLLNELYENGQLTPNFLEYLGIDNNQENDNLDESKKVKSSNLKRDLKEDSLDDFIPGLLSKRPFINFYFQVRYFNYYGKESQACRELCNGLENFHSVEDCTTTGKAVSAVVENNPEAIRAFFTDLVELCHQNNTRFWYMHFKTQENELAEPISCYCPKIDNDTCESLDVEKLIQAVVVYLKESKRHSIKENEAVDNRDLTKESVMDIINSSPILHSKMYNSDDLSIYVCYKKCLGIDFYLGKGLNHNYIPRTFITVSAGDEKNVLQVTDVGNGTDGKGYLRTCKDVEYYDELSFYDKINVQLLDILFYSGRRELNDWKCAQHGAWKFEIKSLDDVAWVVEQIEEAINIVLGEDREKEAEKDL
jgi:hypothetical protein